MYYGNLKEYDVADGEGIRVTLFVSGCTNHCKGCFQPATWDFNYGEPYTEETEKRILNFLALPMADAAWRRADGARESADAPRALPIGQKGISGQDDLVLYWICL